MKKKNFERLDIREQFSTTFIKDAINSALEKILVKGEVKILQSFCDGHAAAYCEFTDDNGKLIQGFYETVSSLSCSDSITYADEISDDSKNIFIFLVAYLLSKYSKCDNNSFNFSGINHTEKIKEISPEVENEMLKLLLELKPNIYEFADMVPIVIVQSFSFGRLRIPEFLTEKCDVCPVITSDDFVILQVLNEK